MNVYCRTGILFVAAVCHGPCSLGQTRQFKFEQFPVQVYSGEFHVPEGLHKNAMGDVVDEYGRRFAPLAVGFAGNYYLPVISCGTGCRGYLLADLRTGSNISQIDMFNSGEPAPRTKEGQPYITMLYYRPDSRLLIAEYHLNWDDPKWREACRQRYYVLENGKLRAISKTFPFCTEDNHAQQ